MSDRSARRGTRPIRSAIWKPFVWVSEGLRWRMQVFLQKVRSAANALEITAQHAIGFSASEAKLIRESQAYWNDSVGPSLQQNSHWRGVGIFADELRWLALGHEHLEMYEEFTRAMNLINSPKRIVEWGCGGGMNAIHFGHLAEAFYGIDISPSSLQECGKQMLSAGLRNFTPVLIDVSDPEGAMSQLKKPCDLFLSTYVFELLPTPEYGIRLLRIAYELLAPGGIAMIQIKYSEGNARTRSRRWAYVRNLAWNATYRIEDFWQTAQECGFKPKLVKLLPRQPLVNDRNYAYFLLQK
jgi:SAM-dependent methyltransferase